MVCGDRVKALRKRRGYTQKQFAQLLNAPQSWVSYIERGQLQPSVARLCAMVAALRTNPGYLLGSNASPRPTRCKPKSS